MHHPTNIKASKQPTTSELWGNATTTTTYLAPVVSQSDAQQRRQWVRKADGLQAFTTAHFHHRGAQTKNGLAHETVDVSTRSRHHAIQQITRQELAAAHGLATAPHQRAERLCGGLEGLPPDGIVGDARFGRCGGRGASGARGCLGGDCGSITGWRVGWWCTCWVACFWGFGFVCGTTPRDERVDLVAIALKVCLDALANGGVQAGRATHT